MAPHLFGASACGKLCACQPQPQPHPRCSARAAIIRPWRVCTLCNFSELIRGFLFCILSIVATMTGFKALHSFSCLVHDEAIIKLTAQPQPPHSTRPLPPVPDAREAVPILRMRGKVSHSGTGSGRLSLMALCQSEILMPVLALWRANPTPLPRPWTGLHTHSRILHQRPQEVELTVLGLQQH